MPSYLLTAEGVYWSDYRDSIAEHLRRDGKTATPARIKDYIKMTFEEDEDEHAKYKAIAEANAEVHDAMVASLLEEKAKQETAAKVRGSPSPRRTVRRASLQPPGLT